MANRTIEAILRLSAKLGSMSAFGQMGGKLTDIDRKAKAFNRSQKAINRSMAALPVGRFLGGAALAYGAKQAVTQFAEAERRLNRIAVNADAGKERLADMFSTVNRAASDYAMSQESIAEGLESLVASGRSLDDSLAFLPSVAATAQASGSAIGDIATTADAVSASFGIASDRMQNAFDILVAGGKLGKFELRDMAQYVPTIAPAFAAMGYKGEAGLRRLTAILQTVRMRTGDAGEAATAVQNIFQKMESEETVKKFKKFGVDLRKEFAKARREGRDLVELFVELTNKATNGDLSKLPQLFTDAQFQIGMRALMQGGDAMEKFQQALANVDGATLNDLGKVLSDTQTKIDRMGAAWDKVMTGVGGGVADVVTPLLDSANREFEFNDALESGMSKRGLTDRQKWKMRLIGSASDRAEIAYEAGWRSESGRKADRPRMASPDAGVGWSNIIPLPTERPDPAFAHVEAPRYNRFPAPTARGLAAMDRESYDRDNPMARRIPGGEMFTGGFASADKLTEALSRGGDDARSAIEQGAVALKGTGSEIGQNARSAMDAASIGSMIGAAVAAHIRAAVSNITVNARSGGLPVRADVGRSLAGQGGRAVE